MLRDLELADAVIREIEPFDLSAAVLGLEALGERRLALLDSSLPGSPWASWSFLAWDPIFAIEHIGGRWITTAKAAGRPGGAFERRLLAFERQLLADAKHPWPALDRAWSELAGYAAEKPAAERSDPYGPGSAESSPGPNADRSLVPPFRGGWFGALAYDSARLLEPWPVRAADDLGWPAFDLRLHSTLIAIHHPSERSFAVATRHPDLGSAEEALEPAIDRLGQALAASALIGSRAKRSPADGGATAAPMAPPAAPISAPMGPTSVSIAPAHLESNMSDADYARSFDRLRDYLVAGDLYQANLTRRFEARFEGSAASLWTTLRDRAASPYGALLTGPDRAVVSASPELFLAREHGRLVTRPIKGTRPRGREVASDVALAAELVASPKDAAEHVMIVDVHRNDLGRVCEFGTVRVESLAALETFPTVHHLTSTIAGRVREGVSPWRAIAAAFPAGSITGAPKRRAIEIIEELEPTRRALYCGSIGWLGWEGRFALNVAIRTILLERGRAYFQAGGGIVIDSEVQSEAAETWSKARALYAAIDHAEHPERIVERIAHEGVTAS